MWWVSILTLHLIRDLWIKACSSVCLQGRVRHYRHCGTILRRDFIAQLGTRRPPQIELWPSQVDAAVRAVDPNDDCDCVANQRRKDPDCGIMHPSGLADGKRTVYVTPLRALSAQVERVFLDRWALRSHLFMGPAALRPLMQNVADGFRGGHPRKTGLCFAAGRKCT